MSAESFTSWRGCVCSHVLEVDVHLNRPCRFICASRRATHIWNNLDAFIYFRGGLYITSSSCVRENDEIRSQYTSISMRVHLYTGSRGMALDSTFEQDTRRRRDETTREVFLHFLGSPRNTRLITTLHTSIIAYRYASQSCNWRASCRHFLLLFWACFLSSRPPNASPVPAQAFALASSLSESSSSSAALMA
jgi:hypothetical protein